MKNKITRNHEIKIKVSEAEYKHAKDIANQAGTSISGVLRSFINEGKVNVYSDRIEVCRRVSKIQADINRDKLEIEDEYKRLTDMCLELKANRKNVFAFDKFSALVDMEYRNFTEKMRMRDEELAKSVYIQR